MTARPFSYPSRLISAEHAVIMAPIRRIFQCPLRATSRPKPFHSAFAAERLLLHFFPRFTRAFTTGVSAQGSAMNAGHRRALDWSAPLNSSEPSRVSRRKKLFKEETMPDTTERKDVYSRITAQIIGHLEKGVRPWVRPSNAEHAAGRITRPLRHNGQPYSGINNPVTLDVGPEPEFCRANLDDVSPSHRA
jgi:N-terminal domain of anti-restriction factor ArdC